MSIAIDAMGGDHAPETIVAGAVLAASHVKCKLILVGPPDQIRPLLPNEIPANIEIHPASQVIEMGEKPLDAYRQKKDSSLVVAAHLVKDGKAEAVLSAGNTGAASAICTLVWRQAPGIHRPAIGTIMPNKANGFILLDAGASPDIDPDHIVEFAVLGRAFAQSVLGRSNPSVHLLNIGEEPGKGNAFAKQCYHLLEPFPWFKGNIEGGTVFHQSCDVVVCDAFVGNVFLKASEGVAEFFTQSIRQAIPKNPIARLAYLPMRSALAPIRVKTDYATIGGSPLLGLNGMCTICHGRSSERAIKNAIIQTDKAIQGRLLETVQHEVVAANINVETADLSHS